MLFEISFRRLWQALAITMVLVSSWFAVTRYVGVEVSRVSLDDVEVKLRFVLPISSAALQKGSEVYFSDSRKMPRPKIAYSRTSLFQHILRISEGDIKGLRYCISLRGASVVWPLTVKRTVEVSSPISPTLIHAGPFHSSQTRNVSTRGPIYFKFNTPMDGDSLRAGLKGPVDGMIVPVPGTTNTIWTYYPSTPLKPASSCTFSLSDRIHSESGRKLRPITVNVHTASRLEVLEVFPKDGSTKIWLTRDVKVVFNQPIKTAAISIQGVKGTTKVIGDTALFVTNEAWKPGITYCVKAAGVSTEGETAKYQSEFKTTDIGKVGWVDSSVSRDTSVVLNLMNGARKLDSVVGKMTRPMEQNSAVTLYITDDSDNWLKLNAGIMLHSLEKGMDDTPDNHKRSGLPQSYGCITMSLRDMAKLRSHLKKGSMFILHSFHEAEITPTGAGMPSAED